MKETKNGVKFTLDNCWLFQRGGDEVRPLFMFDGEDSLTEVNLDGFVIMPVEQYIEKNGPIE